MYSDTIDAAIKELHLVGTHGSPSRDSSNQVQMCLLFQIPRPTRKALHISANGRILLNRDMIELDARRSQDTLPGLPVTSTRKEASAYGDKTDEEVEIGVVEDTVELFRTQDLGCQGIVELVGVHVDEESVLENHGGITNTRKLGRLKSSRHKPRAHPIRKKPGEISVCTTSTIADLKNLGARVLEGEMTSDGVE
ncbi:hypothetical protein HG531_010788 [Fusarium graminearum]|nr:hypothetical protein HG531_010788 [Fusarium graminearum]